MAILNVEQLMETCVTELPTELIELESGGQVMIQALKGSETSRIFSNDNLDEKIYLTLSKGLIEPAIRGNKLNKFIDYNPTDSITIFSAILSLSNALGEIEEKEYKEIKKN